MHNTGLGVVYKTTVHYTRVWEGGDNNQPTVPEDESILVS